MHRFMLLIGFGAALLTAGACAQRPETPPTQAAVRNDVSGLPSSINDFTSAATIKSVTVSGKTPGSFSNTLIAGNTLGRISLGSVQTDNDGTPFGVCGESIAAIRGSSVASSTKIALRNLTEPTASTQEGDFILRVL